jgi:tRNA-binding protein
MSEISWADFEKVDMRVGTIVDAEDFPEARNPAYKLIVDFGDLGERKTSAQITSVYSKEELMGQQVIAVVNFPPKQIGPFMSECLVMGVLGEDKDVILLKPDKDVKNGWKIG